MIDRPLKKKGGSRTRNLRRLLKDTLCRELNDQASKEVRRRTTNSEMFL